MIKDRLARPSSQATSFFLPYDSLGVGERCFDQVITQLHQLTRHISSACDQYVQYLLVGVNPSILNQHRTGLQPWRWWLFTLHSPTLPTDGPFLSTYRPRSVSSLSKQWAHDSKVEFKGTYSWHVVFRPLDHLLRPTLRLAISNDQSLAIVSSRTYQKVSLCN
jgi:hypothetical protein